MRELFGNLFPRWFGTAEAIPLRATRWVVVDCETGGLDAARDPLLAVGAVVVRGGRIDLSESFSAVLRQSVASDASNILVHGIGADAQTGGRAPAEALGEFSAFLRDGEAVAFHADFDAAVLRRAMAGSGLSAPRRWVDAARLAPVLFPGAASTRKALDDWLQEFGITCPARHDALQDAYATAQLLLVLLAEAERQGAGTMDRLRRLERSGRWLGTG